MNLSCDGRSLPDCARRSYFHCECAVEPRNGERRRQESVGCRQPRVGRRIRRPRTTISSICQSRPAGIRCGLRRRSAQLSPACAMTGARCWSTTLMDAEPHHRYVLPGPSIWPLLTALAVTVGFAGSVFNRGRWCPASVLTAIALIWLVLAATAIGVEAMTEPRVLDVSDLPPSTTFRTRLRFGGGRRVSSRSKRRCSRF